MTRNNQSAIKGLLNRRLVCLLGLPIDVIDMAGAMSRIRHAVDTRERLFLSTPNLNFLVAAQSDDSFRESVLRSDLSVADGISLVMLGRILRADLPERVTGSDLFEQLALADTAKPIKVFFFGGPPGAAQRAAERLNRDFKGMTCVGYYEPGFGDVESMSSPAIIDHINQSGADFVVAALGAKKGQAWLMHNQHRLHAPVISHLGAVVNFMAGTVRRSPRWLQNIGLEWIWRIVEEPVLWRRYWDDGLVFLSLLAKHALPAAIAERKARKHERNAGTLEEAPSTSHTRTLVLRGSWGEGELEGLRAALQNMNASCVQFDMTEVSHLDTHAIGFLAALHGQLLANGGVGVTLGNLSKAMRREVQLAGASYLMESQTMTFMGAKA